MLRTLHLLPVLLLAPIVAAQTTYTHTLPNMQGSSLSNWYGFTFPAAAPTTGGGELDFYWLACWQSAFGGSSKIWIELRTGTSTYTEVYYETGNVSECTGLVRNAQISAAVMAQALNAGAGVVNGRVKVQDSCYPGVGCSFANDPVVGNFTLSYEAHAANFTVADASVCPGSTIAFTDGSLNTPTSYEWIFEGGVPASSAAQNPTVQYAAPGNYDVTLIVETADGMDTLVRTGYVTVHALPDANAGVDEVMCTDESEQLQASGGVAYQWFPPDGLDDADIAAPVATPGTTTSYTVLVTDANGCEASDYMILTVHDLPTVVASAGNNTICLGDTAYIVTVGAQLYQWSPNLFISSTSGAAVEAWPTSTFTWMVTGTDGFGCVNDTTVTIVVEPPPSAPVVTNNGSELSSTLADGYQWSLNGTPIEGATTQTWTPLVNGNYNVTITDANGCSAMGLPVYFGTVGLSETDVPVVRLFPQPAHDVLCIAGLTRSTPGRVLDANGRVVERVTISTGTIDISALTAGRYVLELEVGGTPVHLPFVKE